jgi:hypothetical protein
MFRFMVAFTASFIQDTSCLSRMFRFMIAFTAYFMLDKVGARHLQNVGGD